MAERKELVEYPGDAFVLGLLGFARRQGVSVEQAGRIVLADLYVTEAPVEHRAPTIKAIAWVKQNPEATIESLTESTENK